PKRAAFRAPCPLCPFCPLNFRLLVSTTPFTIFDMIPLSRAVGPPDNREPITDNCAKSASAFTLIEMIVVMLIIATLAAALLTAGFNTFERARKVQAKNDVTQI